MFKNGYFLKDFQNHIPHHSFCFDMTVHFYGIAKTKIFVSQNLNVHYISKNHIIKEVGFLSKAKQNLQKKTRLQCAIKQLHKLFFLLVTL